MFTVELVVITTIMSYLRLNSKSVWPAILMHATHNLVDQAICNPLTSAGDKAYFVGETGFITVIVVMLIAIVTIVKRNREDV